MRLTLPTASLYFELRRAGVEFAVRDGRLHVRGSGVSPELLQRLSACKSELAEALATDPTPVCGLREVVEPCRWCRRSLWWATRPDPTLWTCGACHPPVAALGRVFWRDGQANNSGGLP